MVYSKLLECSELIHKLCEVLSSYQGIPHWESTTSHSFLDLFHKLST